MVNGWLKSAILGVDNTTSTGANNKTSAFSPRNLR
jgi:hypothetical protein